MLPLDDPKWKEMRAGYKVPYDPTPALRKLAKGESIDNAWQELWTELHHQGDIGEASYAAVPHLVRFQQESGSLDWNLYALVSTIEIERQRVGNPPVPEWLQPSYDQALQTLLEIALRDLHAEDNPLTIKTMIEFIALQKGERKLAALIGFLDQSELNEFAEKYLSWSELYGA